MGLMDEILDSLEQASQENQKGGPKQPVRPVRPVKRLHRGKWAAKKTETAHFKIAGHPIVWPPLNWDDLGLGLVRSLGFVPNKAVRLEFEGGRWSLTGARANSSVVFFIAAGGFGLVYFLQDLISQIENWGPIASSAIFIIPMLANLLVRTRTIQFEPYEIETLGYDPENNTIVLSTFAQVGGRVALRIDMPHDKKLKQVEEAKLLRELSGAHNGFNLIEGLAKPDYSKFKNWTLWTLVWAVIIYFSMKYY